MTNINFPALTLGLIAFGVLAGCNSTTSTNGTTATTAMAATTTRTANTNKPLLEALQARNQNTAFTTMASLPTTGSAKYTGFAQIFSDSGVIPAGNNEAVGVADLDVGFANGGSMTGTVTDFDDQTGTYTGTLTVTGGAISQGTNSPQVRSVIAGTLTRSTGQVIDVSGNLTGGFNGATGEYLSGADKVTLTSGATSAVGDITVNAERQ